MVRYGRDDALDLSSPVPRKSGLFEKYWKQLVREQEMDTEKSSCLRRGGRVLHVATGAVMNARTGQEVKIPPTLTSKRAQTFSFNP